MYDEPPDTDVIGYVVISPETQEDFLNRQAVKTAKKLTEIKDLLGDLF